MPTVPPARTRGRQAEAARNDRLLLDAARHVFTTQGADAPVSAIAARAGVGIGSLYRRYPTKEALLQHLCVLAMEQTVEAASAGLEEEDAWSGLAGYVRSCVERRTGALAPVAGTIAVTPAMLRTSRRGMRLADALVDRAQAAGVLRRDVSTLDISLLIEQFSRRSATMPAEEEGNARGRLLAIALDGLRAPGTAPLPGRPPSRAAYVGRWDLSNPASSRSS
jgi:AcrR family transcriptional regulator